jgi:hypothetical protein
MYHLVCLPCVANCTFFNPAFGLQLKNEIHFISAKPQHQRLRPPEPRSISSSPIIPRRPSSPLVISLPGSPEDSSGIVDDEYRTRISSPKQSPSPSLPLRRVAQKVTEEAPFSSQSSVHSSRSSLSEEAEAGPSLVSSLVPVPPPVPARRAKVLNSHSQKSYNGNANSSLPRHTTSVGDSPHPPLRYGLSVSPIDSERFVLSSTKPISPPPLPSRPFPTQETVSAIPNRTEGGHGSSPVIQIQERKPLGAGKLPPPPTRAIGLGDKLPPPRRLSASSDDSGEEDEPPREPTTIDMLPDSSTSSRRAPTLRFRDVISEPNIHIHPHSGCIAVSGSYVIVGHGHHIKVYDLARSDVPIFNLDTRDMGLKEAKVTCMEFRPTISNTDRGFLLWIGTKDGHLFEVDVRTGIVRGTKYVAHLHPVTYIFRHGRSMVTLDESGKALIFSPDIDYEEDISLQVSPPRIIRTTEKQGFATMIRGKLWTAARMDHQGQRLPTIRVYDIFNSACAGRSILPTEHVGPVTSATILSSQSEMVYVGHEEGYISLWDLDTDDGYPQCIEVVKVSMSDILCLEGVNERLWVGGRNGMISVYDISQRPWFMTNCWNAHPGLPVMKLIMNHYAIEKTGQLCVASVGRDEHVRLWDGLLGFDWIGSYFFLVICLKANKRFLFILDLRQRVTQDGGVFQFVP